MIQFRQSFRFNSHPLPLSDLLLGGRPQAPPGEHLVRPVGAELDQRAGRPPPVVHGVDPPDPPPVPASGLDDPVTLLHVTLLSFSLYIISSPGSLLTSSSTNFSRSIQATLGRVTLTRLARLAATAFLTCCSVL